LGAAGGGEEVAAFSQLCPGHQMGMVEIAPARPFVETPGPTWPEAEVPRHTKTIVDTVPSKRILEGLVVFMSSTSPLIMLNPPYHLSTPR